MGATSSGSGQRWLWLSRVRRACMCKAVSPSFGRRLHLRSFEQISSRNRTTSREYTLMRHGFEVKTHAGTRRAKSPVTASGNGSLGSSLPLPPKISVGPGTKMKEEHSSSAVWRCNSCPSCVRQDFGSVCRKRIMLHFNEHKHAYDSLVCFISG